MKRTKLIKHLSKNGCVLLREGKKHSYNPMAGKISAIPRHFDIKQFTAEKICKDLEVIFPAGK
ncbi:MAG TPA: addiction module toxin, HicA family [Mariniphaga anaerophila]|uniref:Addiction module toxin, HicA family n=1 Tax=Mariniphaga anaerophila TaxID=1484053 RepID=A0A831LX95_9BACT|nr:addiction module toxin, HicA family [Mariniphaga anaerophila]